MGLSIGTLFPLRWRLWLGKRLFRQLGPKTTRVSWHRVIKGPVDPTEVEAMHHITSHTTIPIPQVYATHIEKGIIYIEMSYVPGEELEVDWKSLSVAQKDIIFADIKKYISILRELQPPAEDLVMSALRNPASDCRVGIKFFGPCSHAEFHKTLRYRMAIEHVAEDLNKDIELVHSASYRACLTHSDLAPRNIIVRNGRVAAIIDWAYSGWYPEHWELTKAYFVHTLRTSREWLNYVSTTLPNYEKELRADKTLWTKLPDPGTTWTGFRSGREGFIQVQTPRRND